MGDPAWASEERFRTVRGRVEHEAELDEALAGWTSEHEAYGLMERLEHAGVEAGVVQNMKDLQHDPQLEARDHFEEITHDLMGPMRFERSGFRISNLDGGYRSPGPKLGEHNEGVLGEVLGLSNERIAELIEEDVIV
jgi:formyl-CoA transferase